MPSDTAQQLSHAEYVLQELRRSYIDELPYKIDQLEQLVLHLKNGSDFKKTYGELLRGIHSLKGSAGIYGLYIIGSICHQLEDQLRIVDNGEAKLSEGLADNWLQYIDLMREVVEYTRASGDSFSGIEKKLEALRRSTYPNTVTGILVTGARYIEEICSSVIAELPVQLSVLDNGYEALGRIMQENFDFVITDKEIGGINGIALIAATKFGFCTDKNIRCMLITSDQTVHSARDCDPDFVIARDSGLAARLHAVISELTTTPANVE